MTVGNISRDNRVSKSGTNCGAGLCGLKYTKVWSGGDLLPADFGKKYKPPHAYSMVSTSDFVDVIRYSNNGGASYTTGVESACFGGLPIPALIATADKNNLYNKVLLDLRYKVERGDFDLSVFLGTAHQSLNTIAETAHLLYEAQRAVRKGQVKKAKKILTERVPIWHPHLENEIVGFKKVVIPQVQRVNKTTPLSKTAANNWLSLQYGWLPLVSDMYSAAELVSNQLYEPRRFSRTSRKSITRYLVSTDGFRDIDQFHRYGVQLIAYYSEGQNQYSLAQSGVLNPENLAWELLPWSFVVDWALPVGDYLEARAFAQRVQGQFVQTIFEWKDSRNRRGHPGTLWKVEGTAKRTEVSVTRTLPATLVAKLPQIKPFSQVISWRRAANALALLTQGFL